MLTCFGLKASSVVSYTSEFSPILRSPSYRRPNPFHCSDPNCYEKSGSGCFAVYGVEYKPGFDNGVCTSLPHSGPERKLILTQYILWINDNKHAWTARSAGFAADTSVQIGPRPIPQEPMVLYQLPLLRRILILSHSTSL